jgi:hypothetical protein
MSENAAAFANLDDNVNEIRGKFDQFAAGLMTKMVPALTSVTDKIANIDAAGFGMMLSDYIAKMIGAAAEAFKLTSAIDSIKMAIESIVSGNFSEGLSLMWVTMKVTALNAINEIVSNFMAGFMTVRDFIAEMFNSQGALAHLMNTMFSTAAAYMKEQLSSSLADFMEAIGRIAMAEKFRYEAETAREHIERNLFAMGAQFELVGEQAAAAGRAMPENFEKNKDSLQPLFDLTPALAEQERLHESIKGKLEEMKTSTEGIATNAQSFSESLLSSETSLQNSELLTRSITLNLENSALASKRIASAFSLAEESSQSIAFNLETTSASTEEASGWLNKGATETERISLHGNEFASAADNAAGAIANAKVDAKITSDLFTGLSDRMNSAVNATSAMLDQMRETFHFGKMTEEEKVAMSRLETKQRLAENARDRAHERAARLEKLGFEKTAHELRMRADAKLTETLEKLRPELEKATESARQAMERGGQTAETGMRTGSNVAKTALLEGGNVAKDAIMKAADALKNSLPDPSKQSALALESTLDLCRGLLSSIDAKLPQHALS